MAINRKPMVLDLKVSLVIKGSNWKTTELKLKGLLQNDRLPFFKGTQRDMKLSALCARNWVVGRGRWWLEGGPWDNCKYGHTDNSIVSTLNFPILITALWLRE